MSESRLIDYDKLTSKENINKYKTYNWSEILSFLGSYSKENGFIDAKREEDILKFYYCESEDDYYLGQRVDNFYYAKYNKDFKQFVWCISRYLPWGQHIIDERTMWKEHTYSSEPKEIGFAEWLNGFIKKYINPDD